MWFSGFFSLLFVCHSWSVPMMKITGLSHLLRGRTCTIGGWLNTFCPTVQQRSTLGWNCRFTWTGRLGECPLQSSYCRRCGTGCRRPRHGPPRSSRGTRWCRTWGLTPWSRWTSGIPSFSAPDPPEWLWLLRGQKETQEWKEPGMGHPHTWTRENR